MEQRIRKLENTVAQQGYLLWICLGILVFTTAALLVLWGAKGSPDFDHIAVSLTVFQMLFGIAAVYGFWALRGLTREKAEEVAEAEVRKILPSMVRRHIDDYLQARPQEAPILDDMVDEVVDAIGGKEDGDG